MDVALGPLDIVELSKEKEKKLPEPLDTAVLAKCLEGIFQKAVKLVQNNAGKDFLYKNPNGRKRKLSNIVAANLKLRNSSSSSSSSSSTVFGPPPSSSTSIDDFEYKATPWALIKNFTYPLLVHQINEYVETWVLSPGIKYVVIAHANNIEHVPPFGDRYFAEVHFSKPTPKCPNPLAVAKVHFTINVSHLLPDDYPVNVNYRFEGHKIKYYTMGRHKITTNKFQNDFINSILHMKLAFYAKMCDCRNPLTPLQSRKKSVAVFGSS